jgi:hypothetical protein
VTSTLAGAAQQTRSSTTCQTLCPSIPIKATHSYVSPSTGMIGALITSIVNGHSKTKEATAAGSTRDMLFAGAGAGASSGAAADPRAAVEAVVSTDPDDPSEGVYTFITCAAQASKREQKCQMRAMPMK